MFNKGVCPSLSIERLGLDLTQDPLQLLNDLLRQCWFDFSQIYAIESLIDGDIQKDKNSTSTQIYALLTDRLNALVVLSPRVFFRLRNAANLRQPMLIAVYRILSLALWCRQRAIRCAGLRCLRYYVRTSEDVDAFLANRLDLFITRCLDLSYMEELLALLSIINEDSRYSERAEKPQHIQRPGGPYRRLLDNSKCVVRNVDFQRPFHEATSRAAEMDTTERLAVIRLAFHLLRLSVRAFSPDLVHGLAAAFASTSATVLRPAELNLNREVGEEAPPLFSPLSTQVSATRDGDVCLRGYLLLLTEFVMRSSEVHVGRCNEGSDLPAVATSCCPPLEVAVKSLLNALPCCGEPGGVFKHPAQIFEVVLLALLRLSAESQYGRRVVDSWVFQKCVAPFLVTYPLVTIPRSPFDSNPSFIAATRDSLVLALRSWSGLFYFLREGRPCLHALTQSLLLGSSKIRALVLNVLYNLFPGVPALIRTNPADDTANSIAGDLSSALYTGLPYPLASHHPGRRQQQSPFPYLDGDFVVEEGLRLFPLVQSAGTDVLEAHSALLLCSFAQAGLFEALISAVDDASLYVSAAAGQLLGILSFRANSQLHPNSLCMERLTSIPLLRDKFRAVDFLERVHQILMERHHAGARPILSAPLISPFLECLSRQQRSPSTPLPPSVPTSVGSKSADIGPVSLMQKASVGAVTTSPSSRSVSASQHTDGLLEAVIVASGVCASSSIANTITVQSLAGCSMAATSMLGKSAFLTHVPISHPPIPGVPNTTLILSSPYEWDWDVLASWARKLSSSANLFSWKDQNSQIFLTRLIDFITPNLEVLSLSLEVAYPTGTSPLYPLLLKPTNSQEDVFPLSPAYLRLLGQRGAIGSSASSSNSRVIPSLSWTSCNWPQTWAAATLLSGLLPHLSLYQPDSFPGAQLRRFLISLRSCLLAAITPSASSMTCAHLLFQPSHLREHCSSLLLFGLGRLLSCEAGSSLLHDMEIPDLLHSLIVGGSGVGQDLSALKLPNPLKNLHKQRLLCAKFLLPSMSYTGSGFGYSLLATICSSGHTALRLFAVKFIRLLLRLNIPSTAIWLVPLLLNLSCDRSPKVFHEAISVLEEACLNPMYLQALLDYMQTEDRHSGKRCCTAFPSPLLRLLSIGSLSSQRVIACLLAKSAWMFKVVSTPKPVALRSPLAVYPGGGINGTLLECILRAWMDIYNEQYAESIESRLMNSFRLPSLQNHCDSTTELCPRFLQHCPACNHQLSKDYETDKRSTEVEDELEEDFFLDHQSNRLFFSHLDEVAGAEVGLGTEEEERRSKEVTFDLSPVAVQLFYRNNGSLFVPLHLFYCLALQETGFRVLRDNGYLTNLADALSRSCHPATDDSDESHCAATHVKAAIWALASILVTPYGSRWARAPAVLQDIFWLIANADSLSVRGTAWLGVCFVASSVCGGSLLRPWMVGSGEKGGMNAGLKMATEDAWLLSTTDRDAHMWPLLERRVLCLNSQASKRAMEVRHTPFASPRPPSKNEIASLHTGGHERPPMTFIADAHHQDTHLSVFSLGCINDSADSNLVAASTTTGTVAAAAITTSPSAHSPASPMENAKTAHSKGHFLRPMRWIARRAIHSLCGQHGGAGNSGRGVDFNLPTDHDNGDGLETAVMVGEGRERTVSITSATSGHVVGDGNSAMVQSLSSPSWFHSAHASDPATDSKSASASPVEAPTATTDSHHFGLTDVFVFRGLFLPSDVSILGKNFFSCSPTSHRRSTAHRCNGAKNSFTDGSSVNGDMNKKAVESPSDCIQKLCISEACRSANSPCPQPAEDAEVESWRREVVEEVKNLMNSLFLGRVCSNLLVLSHRAYTDILRGRRHRNFASACLHAEVSQILFNYHYSRLARTLVQTFLGQFPPFTELLADAKSALEDWNNATSLGPPPDSSAPALPK
ncbi:rapamycin insensitive companion of mTOR [Echinococcus multilocularis]|uniref:Rapamycin insensitive companion of mTOR n=1 Tax=Echinococcus multilocularis TaxID=6211 RepID=A0A068YA87_ECHMU|nr:rapamycin insensitive companion of mTOR [Echinococcus multilocularis]